MSYTIPTLENLVKEGQLRHRAELPGTDAFLWPNTEYVFITAVAGLVHLNFQYLEWIKRQRFATEADGDELDNHAKPFGMTRNAAQLAHGKITVKGVVGTTLPVGTKVSRSDGFVFSIVDEVTIQAEGFGITNIVADQPGAEGNTTAGAVLTLSALNPSITDVFVDDIGIGGGSALEDDESLRARVLFRMRNPPRGGAAHDYVAWGLAVPGVTRVWVDPLAYGPGTVGVWFMADTSSENGIPDNTQVDDVAAYIESQRPVTARVIVQAPVAAPIDVRISGIGVPSEAMSALIKAELSDVFRRRVNVSMPKAPYTLPVNLLWQAVARITGSAEHKVTLPSDDVTFLPGYVPTLGTICYV